MNIDCGEIAKLESSLHVLFVALNIFSRKIRTSRSGRCFGNATLALVLDFFEDGADRERLVFLFLDIEVDASTKYFFEFFPVKHLCSTETYAARVSWGKERHVSGCQVGGCTPTPTPTYTR